MVEAQKRLIEQRLLTEGLAAIEGECLRREEGCPSGLKG